MDLSNSLKKNKKKSTSLGSTKTTDNKLIEAEQTSLPQSNNNTFKNELKTPASVNKSNGQIKLSSNTEGLPMGTTHLYVPALQEDENNMQQNEERPGEEEIINLKDDSDADEDVFRRYYRQKIWFILLIRFCCIASVVSVCMNTPQTFKKHPSLRYITLVVDIVTGLILTCEALIKIRAKGFILSPKAYLRSPGRILEFVMVWCIIVSIVLQVLELAIALDDKAQHYLLVSFIRAPRPLLLLRVMKSVLNLSLPKTVSLRSMKQIWGVLLFTLYFMTLAALIGVQIFGVIKYYCVKETALVNEVKYTDLLIPATRCSPLDYAFQCPKGFTCKELKLKKFRQDRRYFDQILTGLLSVYEAASMEGWSFVMYDAMNSRYFLYSVLYFVCVIFFIAWLVRNVFIAIITEAFADLRVQVSRLSKRKKPKQHEQYQVLKHEADGTVLLVREEQVALKHSPIRRTVLKCVHSRLFQYFIHICVLVDACVQGFVPEMSFTKYVQVGFTILFNIEALLKICGMGFSNYRQSLPCRFEGVLCIGSTAFLAPVFMGVRGFAVFQVLRPFRLILFWKSLTAFLKRILGSGKKISSLILFTLSALVIVSGITLQLFCGIGINETDYDFDIFPKAMRAMYQVFMAEAWNEVMDKVLFVGGYGFSFLVYPVFILVHLLGATILVSVFVALILDNLELSEELKMLKQRRLGEEVADTHEKLPHRLRVFDHLKPRPKVIDMDNVECSLPKIRRSFVTNYVSSADDIDNVPLVISNLPNKPKDKQEEPTSNADIQLSFVQNKPRDRSYLARFRKQSSVTALMQDAHKKRMSIHSTASEGSIKTPSSKSFRRSSRTISVGSKRHRNTAEPRSPHLAHQPLGKRVTNASSVIYQTNKLKNDKNRKLSRDQKDIDVSLVRQKLEEAQRKKEIRIENLRENHPKFDESLFIFSTNNPIRKFIQKIVHARYDTFTKDERSTQLGAFSFDRLKRYLGSQTYLDWVMLFFTQVSCLAMLLETPSHRTFDSPWLSSIEYVFVVTTSIELALKIIADGLFLSPKAFIQDVGGALHVMIYIVSLTYVCWQPDVIPPASGAQILLVLRALRPLRIITLAPPLRKVVWILVSGYRDMLKVALLQVILMFVFASYGVQTFRGKLKRCNDRNITLQADCIGAFQVQLAAPKKLNELQGEMPTMLVPRVWRNPRNFNFDTMNAAFLALFEVLSLEGWTDVRDIMHEQVGWTGSIYPHVYVFFACLIGLTLFIGVIVGSFNENKGLALLTVQQKRWKDLKKKLELAQPLHLPSKPLEGSLKSRLFEIFAGARYQKFYALIVLINCGTLFFGQWEPRNIDDNTLWLSCIIISIICCTFFTFEAILKIYSFTFKGYWLSWRNRFDFVLTLFGNIYIIWTVFSCHVEATENSTCSGSRMLGVSIFVLRFLTLSGKHNGLRMLMLTVVMSLTKSFYTISVLVMIMTCYAFVGVIMFGSVKHGLALNRQVNFETSWNALLVLFRVTTGEDWHRIMHDAMIAKPYCRTKPRMNYWESNCGNRTAALLFFNSYYVIISYIFLNLFIAVVIENFSIFYSTDDDPIMSQQEIQHYQEIWNVVDRDKSGSISVRAARFLLRLLGGSFDLEKQKQYDPLYFKRVCAEIEKKRSGKNVSFHNLLFILAFNKIDISKSLQLEERLAREELESVILEEVATETIRRWLTEVLKRMRGSKPTNKCERKLSGISGLSEPSINSLHSDFDEMNASATSLHSSVAAGMFPHPMLGHFSPGSSYETMESTTTGLRKRVGDNVASAAPDSPSGGVKRKRELKSDFYSWWDDEVEDC